MHCNSTMCCIAVHYKFFDIGIFGRDAIRKANAYMFYSGFTEPRRIKQKNY